MSTNSTTNTNRGRRLPKAPTPASARSKKLALERDAFYTAAELQAVTGYGRGTVYAILRMAEHRPAYSKRRVTGAEFLALRAAYYGYADVA